MALIDKFLRLLGIRRAKASMSAFWSSVMDLSDHNRYNLAKGFNYLDASHFQTHRMAVKDGIKCQQDFF